MLANIGTGSQPEYGVWVYGDDPKMAWPVRILRTKVNLNYDNTTQIANGPYSPMPTNLVNWTPLGFFTNAADLLLRSQAYNYFWTNYTTNSNHQLVATGVYTTNLYFGITNIPIFRVYQLLGVQYNEAVHRMLQLAANIYSDSVSTNTNAPIVLCWQWPLLVRHPFVFKPLFGIVGSVGQSNWGVNIIGFTNVVNAANALNQIQNAPYMDLTANNFTNNGVGGVADATKRINNFSGIPWIDFHGEGFAAVLSNITRVTARYVIRTEMTVLQIWRCGQPFKSRIVRDSRRLANSQINFLYLKISNNRSSPAANPV